MFKPKPIQQQLQPCRVKEEDAAKCSLHQGFDNNACSTEPLSRSSTTLQGLVQFEESVDIIPLQINIRSPDDIWYQKHDYKRFHQEKKETLRHFRQAQAHFHNIDESIFCLRGFEAYLSPRAVQQKLLRKVAAVRAVVDVQNYQRNAGRNNELEIQYECCRVTATSKKQALKRAVLDAADVKAADNRNSVDGEEAKLRDEIQKIQPSFVHPMFRPPSCGSLQLRKTVPNTA